MDAATEVPGALVDLDELRGRLGGRELPGAELTVSRHQAAIADHAFLAPDTVGSGEGPLHPTWFLVLALRGMGITVDELCALAAQRDGDTLLFGSCRLAQHRSPVAGQPLQTTARVGEVVRKQSRSGAVLDFVPVDVQFRDAVSGDDLGALGMDFVFRRAA